MLQSLNIVKETFESFIALGPIGITCKIAVFLSSIFFVGLVGQITGINNLAISLGDTIKTKTFKIVIVGFKMFIFTVLYIFDIVFGTLTSAPSVFAVPVFVFLFMFDKMGGIDYPSWLAIYTPFLSLIVAIVPSVTTFIIMAIIHSWYVGFEGLSDTYSEFSMKVLVYSCAASAVLFLTFVLTSLLDKIFSHNIFAEISLVAFYMWVIPSAVMLALMTRSNFGGRINIYAIK